MWLSWYRAFVGCEEALGSIWVPHRLGVEAHPCNSSTQKIEVRGSEVQGHSQLRGEFEANLGYMRPCLKEINDQGKALWESFFVPSLDAGVQPV